MWEVGRFFVLQTLAMGLSEAERFAFAGLILKGVVNTVLLVFAIVSLCIAVDEGIENDEDKRLHALRIGGIILSWVLLLPYVVESLSVSATYSRGYFASEDDAERIEELRGLKGFFGGILLIPITIFCLPFVAFEMIQEDQFRLSSILWNVGKTLVTFVDLFLSFSLFPLAFYLLLQAKSVGDVLLNIVAIQIFAQLDDVFTRMVLRMDLQVLRAMETVIIKKHHFHRDDLEAHNSEKIQHSTMDPDDI